MEVMYGSPYRYFNLKNDLSAVVTSNIQAVHTSGEAECSVTCVIFPVYLIIFLISDQQLATC